MTALSKFALVTAGLLALATHAPTAAAATDTAADEAALRAGTATWVEAYNGGDADRVVALYTEDAVMMPPDAPLARGHAMMRQFLTKDIAASKAAGVTLVIGDESTGVSGSLGWHSGTFKVRDAAGATVGTGKFLEAWVKHDGKWRILRDIWNNDAPAK